jgi:hypothetical protein
MPFVTARKVYYYGLSIANTSSSAYCQNNTSASDYGKCYNLEQGQAIFIQSNTATYPVGSLPCEQDGTCIRYTNVAGIRTLDTVYSYSGKQAILQYFVTRSHASHPLEGRVTFFRLTPHVSFLSAGSLIIGFNNYEATTWPVYDATINYKAYVNPYTIPSGYVNIARWAGNVFTPTAYLICNEATDNAWYAFATNVAWAYESSPLAVIPLNYDKEYMVYQELRNAFGYAATGVDQPGWNADDIISVLKELFPDRAWAVFDDRTYTLYLYNLTPDYVPDWLVEKLAPISMKVLKQPADSSAPKAWLDELNRINAYEAPPSVEV